MDESAINGLLISALLEFCDWAYCSYKLHPMRIARIDGSSISFTDVISYMKTHSKKFLAENLGQNILTGKKYFSLSFCCVIDIYSILVSKVSVRACCIEKHTLVCSCYCSDISISLSVRCEIAYEPSQFSWWTEIVA